MGVNQMISKRLKTDLADVARASVDPVFSQQLTESQFRDRAFEKKRKAALEDAERVRQQQLADEERQTSQKLQLAGINMAFQQALNTGDWRGWAKFMAEPNPNLTPELRGYAETLNHHQGQKSIDRLKLEHQWEKDFNAADLKEREFVFKQTQEWADQDQWKAEQFIRSQKLHLQQMEDIRDQKRNTNYRQMMVDFVKETPFIQNPRERDGYLTMLRDAVSNDQITQVWDQIHGRDQARLDNMEKAYRNRVQANATKAAIGTAPSNFDIAFAADVLNEKLGDRWDAMDKESQDKMARYVADQTRYLSRDQRTASSNEVLQVVDKAISGLQKVDYGWWWGVPDEDFSVGRAQQGGTQDLANEADNWARQNGIQPGEVYEYGGRRWRFGG